MPTSSESIKINGVDEEKLRFVLIIMQEQNGKELSSRKQERYMFPHFLYSSQISKVTDTTRV